MNFGQKCVLADQDVATCAADVLFQHVSPLGGHASWKSSEAQELIAYAKDDCFPPSSLPG